jgi:hypothetical protein
MPIALVYDILNVTDEISTTGISYNLFFLRVNTVHRVKHSSESVYLASGK